MFSIFHLVSNSFLLLRFYCILNFLTSSFSFIFFFNRHKNNKKNFCDHENFSPFFFFVPVWHEKKLSTSYFFTSTFLFFFFVLDTPCTHICMDESLRRETMSMAMGVCVKEIYGPRACPCE